jgi:thiaminase/transcriptional activator TenA
VLSGEEEGLFRDEFQRWGLAPGVHAQPEPLPTTKAFGSYLTYLAYDRPWAEALMALCTTEWTYLDWATRLSLTGKAPANPAYRQWIEIHAVPPFADFVAWLRKRVEAEALQADTTRLAAVFRDCLRYECMFWEMAYHGESWPVPGGRKL